MVLLAVYLDRLTAALGDKGARSTSLLTLLTKARAQRATAVA